LTARPLSGATQHEFGALLTGHLCPTPDTVWTSIAISSSLVSFISLVFYNRKTIAVGDGAVFCVQSGFAITPREGEGNQWAIDS
jgi:hypothetical protein